VTELRSAREAEAASAGEQLAKEYFAETHSMSDRSRSHACPGRILLGMTIGIDFPMPQETHARRQPPNCLAARVVLPS